MDNSDTKRTNSTVTSSPAVVQNEPIVRSCLK